MDLRQILKTSRIFYRDHNLPKWRAELPKKARIDDEENVVGQVVKSGFTHGFAFPPFTVQIANLDDLIEETVRIGSC